MKRILLFINFLFALNLVGQTITGTPPSAYTVAVTNTSNAFYSSVSGYNKFQFIYTNTELFNFTASIPSGSTTQLNQLWFKHGGSTVPAFSTLSNFKITLGHSNSTPNALSTTYASNFSSTPVICFSSASFIYTVSGTWAGINLTTPFVYDGVSNLCVQIEYTASPNPVASNLINTAFQTLATNLVTNVTGTTNAGRPVIGFGTGTPCNVPNFSLPNDTLVCGTSAITLNAPPNVSSGFTYQWIRKPTPTSLPATYVNMGTLSSQLTTTTTATYILVVSNIPFTCSKRDSITVTFGTPAPSFNLGPDILFCGLPPNYNNTTQLKPLPALITPVTGLTFQWTGLTLPPAAPGPITGIPTATAQTTTPTGAGQYILTVTRTLGGCKTRDTINLVSPVPKFTLPNDTTVCNGVALTINAPSTVTIPPLPGYTVSWFSHPFASAASPTPLGSGASVNAPITNLDHYYVLVVTSPAPGSCTKKDSIRVRYNTGGINFTLGPDVFFCKTPSTIQLKPIPLITPTAGLTFSWSALDLVANTPVVLIPAPTNNQTYTPTTNPGRYTLKVTTAVGCVTTATVKLFDKSVPNFSILPSKLPTVYPKDTFLCNSAVSFNLNVPIIVSTSNYSYTWIEHPITAFTPNITTVGGTSYATNPTFTERYYTLKVFNGSCFKSDSTRVYYVNLPANFLGTDLEFCGQQSNNDNSAAPIGVQIKPLPLIAPSTGYTFAWTGKTIAPPASTAITGIPTPTAQTTTPPKTGEYKLTVTKGSCVFKDSIRLTPLIPNIKLLSKDTSFCNGQVSSNIPVPASVNTSPPFTYSWYNYTVGSYALGTNISSSNNVTALPSTLPNFPGQYFVLTVNNGTCIRKDSIKVRFGLPTNIDLINDTFYCTAANTVKLKPKNLLPTLPAAPSNVYTWTGFTLAPVPAVIPAASVGTITVQSTTPTVPGKYFLNYTNIAGCKSKDSVILNNYKVVIPSPLEITSVANGKANDTVLCTASSYAMKGPNLPTNVSPYLWTHRWYKIPNIINPLLSSTQNYTATATGSGSGQYIIYVKNNFCQDSDKINLVFSGLPPVNLGSDDTLCIPFSKTLIGPTAPVNSAYTYNWIKTPSSALSNNQNYTASNAGSYVLTITNQYGCKNKDTVKIDGRSITPFSLGNDTGACFPTPIFISGPINTLPSPNLYKYSWNTNPLTTSISTSVSAIGNYSLTLTVKNGPCVLKDSINVEILSVPIVTLPNDTNICGKNLYSVTVKPQTIDNSLNYLWSDGTIGPINTITFDGLYSLQAKNKYCATTDFYQITSRVKPALNSFGPDKEYCESEIINLLLDPINNYFPPSPFVINWLPGGQTTKSILVTVPGEYIIKVKNGPNCEASDTIKVKSIKVPKVIIPDSLLICGTGDVFVNASCKAKSYLWNTGITDSVITISDRGFYSVEASNGRCKSSASVVVDKLDAFSIGPDFNFCPEYESPIVKIPNVTSIYSWNNVSNPKWTSPNPKKRELSITLDGIYIASISKAACTLYDTITIGTYKNQNVFVPNSFSPNINDNLNQEYFIKATDVKDFNIKVFTRFGEVLFESADPKFTWDGKNKKGERLMSGAYVYAISYKSYCSGDELFRENGILNIF
jgi:gliding motility-associated-like protein